MTGLGTEAEGCQSLSEDMAGCGERTEMKLTQEELKGSSLSLCITKVAERWEPTSGEMDSGR